MFLGEAIQRIRTAEHQAGPSAALTTTFQGTAQAFQSSLQGLCLLLLVAIFVVYIVLGSSTRASCTPLTILSGLPAAGSARC